MARRTSLQIPQGTEGYYIEETLAHRSLQRTVEDACSRWGYLPVQTPVFDYYDLYHPLLSPQSRSRIYRLFDRDGDVLMLRSDVTLFLARQLGLMVDPAELPLRVQYGDSILRHEHPLEISGNEFFQMGAELVGKTGPEADAEIILLHLEILAELGVCSPKCHLGSRALLPGNADSLVPVDDLRDAIRLRNWETVSNLLVGHGVPEAHAGAQIAVWRFIGTPAEFRRLLAEHGDTLGTDQRAAGEHLLSVADLVLSATDATDAVEIDLSEVGTQSYHSGIVFQTYLPHVSGPIASGGRYDDLLEHFGTAASSVGFSLMTRVLQQTLAAGAAPERAKQASGASFADRVADARRRRRSGEAVTL
jgi:ATP phosphoribosyltransferase regulatory subunit